jgi:HTH-type transcriptional regulator/antitoxin HigA
MLCEPLCRPAVDVTTESSYNMPMGAQNTIFDLSSPHPGKILRQLMEERGWSQDDLAAITGRARQTLSELMSGRTTIITLDMAVTLAAAFGNSAEEWMRWDAQHRLLVLGTNAGEVEKRARLYSLAPLRDMQKRGWISTTDDLSRLEADLKKFFAVESLDGDVVFPVATHRTETLPFLNPAEKAWCFRARQIAAALPVSGFSPDRLAAAERELRKIAAYPKEVRHLTEALAKYGIRFVIIEPLPGVKIDGAAFWLDANSPVIALSIRFDRIDAFWFALMHEFAHIAHGDALSVDTDLIDGTIGIAVMLVEDEAERRANERASTSLIPSQELESFIRRVGPLYSKERIIQFANKVKIHPGIIVGQLQHRNEIGFSSNREMLIKIRALVTETALTDGWNKMFSPGVL